MGFEVVISAQAEADLEEIFAWTAEFWSLDRAKRYTSAIRSAVRSLETNPRRFPLAPDQKAFGIEVRQMLIRPPRAKHRILYFIDGHRVVILHIRHTAR